MMGHPHGVFKSDNYFADLKGIFWPFSLHLEGFSRVFGSLEPEGIPGSEAHQKQNQCKTVLFTFFYQLPVHSFPTNRNLAFNCIPLFESG